MVQFSGKIVMGLLGKPLYFVQVSYLQHLCQITVLARVCPALPTFRAHAGQLGKPKRAREGAEKARVAGEYSGAKCPFTEPECLFWPIVHPIVPIESNKPTVPHNEALWVREAYCADPIPAWPLHLTVALSKALETPVSH